MARLHPKLWYNKLKGIRKLAWLEGKTERHRRDAMEKKCENCAFCSAVPSHMDFLHRGYMCRNIDSEYYLGCKYPEEGFCEFYKERSGKTVSETTSDEFKSALQGFASLMDYMWGNNNGTKGLENFLNSDSAVIMDEED